MNRAAFICALWSGIRFVKCPIKLCAEYWKKKMVKNSFDATTCLDHKEYVGAFLFQKLNASEWIQSVYALFVTWYNSVWTKKKKMMSEKLEFIQSKKCWK